MQCQVIFQRTKFPTTKRQSLIEKSTWLINNDLVHFFWFKIYLHIVYTLYKVSKKSMSKWHRKNIRKGERRRKKKKTRKERGRRWKNKRKRRKKSIKKKKRSGDEIDADTFHGDFWEDTLHMNDTAPYYTLQFSIQNSIYARVKHLWLTWICKALLDPVNMLLSTSSNRPDRLSFSLNASDNINQKFGSQGWH